MKRFSTIAGERCLRFIFLLALAPGAQAAQSIVLKWDPAPSPNVSGYRLYYGNSSGHYTEKLEVGNMTSTMVSNLSEGRTYYFAVAAYIGGAESRRSNEISYTVPSSGTTQKSATPPPVQPQAVSPPPTLTGVRDMQEVRQQSRSTSIEASAYGRWCRGEP